MKDVERLQAELDDAKAERAHYGDIVTSKIGALECEVAMLRAMLRHHGIDPDGNVKKMGAHYAGRRDENEFYAGFGRFIRGTRAMRAVLVAIARIADSVDEALYGTNNAGWVTVREAEFLASIGNLYLPEAWDRIVSDFPGDWRQFVGSFRQIGDDCLNQIEAGVRYWREGMDTAP